LYGSAVLAPMPKSLVALLVLAASFTAGRSARSAHGLGKPASSAALWPPGFRAIWVSWVWFDRQARRISTLVRASGCYTFFPP